MIDSRVVLGMASVATVIAATPTNAEEVAPKNNSEDVVNKSIISETKDVLTGVLFKLDATTGETVKETLLADTLSSTLDVEKITEVFTYLSDLHGFFTSKSFEEDLDEKRIEGIKQNLISNADWVTYSSGLDLEIRVLYTLIAYNYLEFIKVMDSETEPDMLVKYIDLLESIGETETVSIIRELAEENEIPIYDTQIPYVLYAPSMAQFSPTAVVLEGYLTEKFDSEEHELKVQLGEKTVKATVTEVAETGKQYFKADLGLRYEINYDSQSSLLGEPIFHVVNKKGEIQFTYPMQEQILVSRIDSNIPSIMHLYLKLAGVETEGLMEIDEEVSFAMDSVDKLLDVDTLIQTMLSEKLIDTEKVDIGVLDKMITLYMSSLKKEEEDKATAVENELETISNNIDQIQEELIAMQVSEEENKNPSSTDDTEDSEGLQVATPEGEVKGVSYERTDSVAFAEGASDVFEAVESEVTEAVSEVVDKVKEETVEEESSTEVENTQPIEEGVTEDSEPVESVSEPISTMVQIDDPFRIPLEEVASLKNPFTDIEGSYSESRIIKLYNTDNLLLSEGTLFGLTEEVDRGYLAKVFTNVIKKYGTPKADGNVDTLTDLTAESDKVSIDTVLSTNIMSTVSLSGSLVQEDIFSTEFMPTEGVARKDLAVYLERMLKHLGFDTEVTETDITFTDVDSTLTEEERNAIGLMQSLGVFHGSTDGNFMPTETATKEQLAKVIYNTLAIAGEI